MKPLLIACLALAFAPVAADPSCEKAIARVVYEGLLEQTPDYLERVIEGIKNTAGSELQQPDFSAIEHYLNAKHWMKAQQNLLTCEELFEKLSSSDTLMPLKDQYLYYRTTQRGYGESLPATTRNVLIRCKTSILKDMSLAATPEELPQTPNRYLISDLIPGLAHAMIGMKIGETREVFIHPSLGYGFNSNFEPGVGLHIMVTLHGYTNGTKKLESLEKALIPTPLTVKNITEEKLSALLKKAAYTEGYVIYNHIPNTLLPKVISELETVPDTSPTTYSEAWSLFTSTQETARFD